jgi:hypothetical protein
VALTKTEAMELRYLERADRPLWGGHLERGEPVTSPVMQRWIDAGLIEAHGTKGYMLTEAGKNELANAAS